ncbi:bifunctional DNA primase/polymerase [Nocardia iowensis]|uniref:Bifunctional DNA primase/polymerase n=1 Tax=Nocardia iowensis TaxID=204891 RepID=A0ABX8RYM2_NOCIO|nr:bifunctional DNA primase/polymerase [Nocardia iowensis]QXN94758.1 bifunctional DNA primase/polymerase [Nocardia iowensis]
MTLTTPQADPTVVKSPLSAALAAAERRWSVFPLSPGRKKPPILKNWHRHASTDPQRIRRWWSWNPRFNVAIATGVSRLYVIDLDATHLRPPAGCFDDALAALSNHLPEPAPSTFTVASPHGWHLYYRAPAAPPLSCTVGRIGQGIDSRGLGGYVVAPGSITCDGAYQVIDDRPVTDLPEALITLLRPPPPPPQHQSARRPEHLDAYLAAVLDRVTHPQPNTRNITVFRAALTLGRLVAGGELDEHHTRTMLTAAAAAHIGVDGFTAAELDRAISNGFRYGAQHPRHLHH